MFRKITEFISGLGGNTLYYPGCLTRFAAPELEENYKKVLEIMKIDFIDIPEFKCCGSPVINAGYEDDFVDLIRQNKEIFKKYGVSRIVTNCPACSMVLNQYYKINALHMTELIYNNLKRINGGRYNEPICYHDPCHLSRGRNITDQPRKILGHLGFEIVEMAHHGKKSLCCGAGGGMKSNYPEVSNKAGKMRASECNTKKLITSCPLCYKHLMENSGDDTNVLELSEVIL